MNFTNEILNLKNKPLIIEGISDREVEIGGIKYPGPVIINNDEVFLFCL